MGFQKSAGFGGRGESSLSAAGRGMGTPTPPLGSAACWGGRESSCLVMLRGKQVSVSTESGPRCKRVKKLQKRVEAVEGLVDDTAGVLGDAVEGWGEVSLSQIRGGRATRGRECGDGG